MRRDLPDVQQRSDALKVCGTTDSGKRRRNHYEWNRLPEDGQSLVTLPCKCHKSVLIIQFQNIVSLNVVKKVVVDKGNGSFTLDEFIKALKVSAILKSLPVIITVDLAHWQR